MGTLQFEPEVVYISLKNWQPGEFPQSNLVYIIEGTHQEKRLVSSVFLGEEEVLLMYTNELLAKNIAEQFEDVDKRRGVTNLTITHLQWDELVERFGADYKHAMMNYDFSEGYTQWVGLNKRDKTAILDLRLCEVGMSCEEYSMLVIAGPYSKDMPSIVRDRMAQHENACSYHQSKTWHQSAVNSFATEAMEKTAREIVEKYSC